jgi:hypothetical protein
MAGKGPISTPAARRLTARDIKSVHVDAQALPRASILENDAAGRIRFPYDAIHVNFMIEVA